MSKKKKKEKEKQFVQQLTFPPFSTNFPLYGAGGSPKK
jgi:hypothetical protein